MRLLPRPEEREDVAITIGIGAAIVIFWYAVGINAWMCAAGYAIMMAGIWVMEGRQVK